MGEAVECPNCSEGEALRGEQDGDDIRVQCLSCGTSWVRGAPRCRVCGGLCCVTRPQHVSLTPRGNQVAVVGQRQVVLCPHCDAPAIDPDQRPNSPVPVGYVSRFTFGEPLATPPREPEGGPDHPAVDTAARPSVQATVHLPPSQGQTPAATPPPPTAGPGAKQQPTSPTVRQAIEALLADGAHGDDSLTLLLLGRHLGPSQRIHLLDEPTQLVLLEKWFDQTWGSQPDSRRSEAQASLQSALDFWRSQGWLAELGSSEPRG